MKKGLFSQPSIDSGIPGSPFISRDIVVTDHIKTLFVLHETTLGLVVGGGVDQLGGPHIFIDGIVPGGDIQTVRVVPYILLIFLYNNNINKQPFYFLISVLL